MTRVAAVATAVSAASSLLNFDIREIYSFCNRRGGSWWRSIPRVGSGRARAIVSWLPKQQASLQLIVEAMSIRSSERACR
jgi:hypothetical protein